MHGTGAACKAIEIAAANLFAGTGAQATVCVCHCCLVRLRASGFSACSLSGTTTITHRLLTRDVPCAQGEVVIYELPGMLVPATAQNLTGKRVARCGSLHCDGHMTSDAYETPEQSAASGRMHVKKRARSICLVMQWLARMVEGGALQQHFARQAKLKVVHGFKTKCLSSHHAVQRCAFDGVAVLPTSEEMQGC